MRNLSTPDLFNAMRYIKNSGVQEQLKPLIAQAGQGDVNIDDIGLSAVLEVVWALTTPENEAALYALLAGPMECNVDDITNGTIDLDDFLSRLETLWNDPGRKRFFRLLSGMISKE